MTNYIPLHIIISAKGGGCSTTRRKVYHTKPKGHHTTPHKSPRLLHLYLAYWNYGTPNKKTMGRSPNRVWGSVQRSTTNARPVKPQQRSGTNAARSWVGSKTCSCWLLSLCSSAFKQPIQSQPFFDSSCYYLQNFRTCRTSQARGVEKCHGAWVQNLLNWRNFEAWRLLRFSLRPFGFLYLTNCRKWKKQKKTRF